MSYPPDHPGAPSHPSLKGGQLPETRITLRESPIALPAMSAGGFHDPLTITILFLTDRTPSTFSASIAA